MNELAQPINDLVNLCHSRSKEAGWYTDLATMQPIQPSLELIGLKLSLVHSEISEALEGERKGLMDDHLPHRKMGEVELADAIIRIADLAGFLKYDIGGAIIEKLAYNAQRADHKIENRLAAGGKKV